MKFGVTSTYNEEMYTTKLNEATLTPAQRAAAERMAAEIEGDTQGVESNPHLAEERVRAPWTQYKDAILKPIAQISLA